MSRGGQPGQVWMALAEEEVMGACRGGMVDERSD
jgi:hypothetical protein